MYWHINTRGMKLNEENNKQKISDINSNLRIPLATSWDSLESLFGSLPLGIENPTLITHFGLRHTLVTSHVIIWFTS